MSSWQEYKKIKKRDAEDVQTSSNLNTEVNKGNMSSWQKFKLNKEDNSGTNISSWQKFKQEKENRKTTITAEGTNTIGKTIQKLADSGKYITKKTGAGVLSGTAGILQAGLTDIANSLRKGEQKNGTELTNNLLDSIIGLTNPTNNIGRMVPKQTEKMLKTIFDKDKNALEKITTLGMDAVTEATDSIGIKRVSDSVLNIAGNFNNKLDDNVLNLNDIISEPINNINSKLTEESENYGTFTNLLADAGQSIGNMVPSMAASAITKNPTIGLATMGISAKGQSTQEALNKGAELDEAIKIGNTKGMIEIGTEMLTGGVNIFGKGALDDIVQKGVVDKVKNNVAKFLVKQGVNASGEVLEETISDILGNVIDKGTVDPDAKYTLKDWEDTAITTVLTTLILNTITGGMVNDIKEINKKNKTDNEQKVYDNEVKERTASKTKQATIEQAYNEQIKAQKNLGIEITEDLKAQIMKKVENAYDNGTLKSTELSKKDIRKIQEQVEKDMQEGNISTENIMKTLGENQDISKDNLLMKSMYENEQKYNSYKVEQTDNEKVNILMQSAADAGMNNTSKTRKKVDLISKLVKDTDRQYKFVSPEQLKEMGYNENANGLINKSTGEILINARSDKGIQSIVGHETTHIFDSKDSKGTYSKEYQTLQDVAIEYAKLKGIYDSKVQSITKAYGDLLVDETQIKEELTADLVGDFLFNDEQFIENLALKNRNVFQKIYDYIKHIYKVATAGTEEAKALENLKYQFDKVYKTISEESNTDTKYSIAGKEGMKNAIKNDTGYLKLERNYNKAQQMQKNGTDNETIRQNTGWFQDKNGDWKFEFSDKDMTLKENIKLEKSKNYKLGDILEHDTLFTIYPELKNYKIKFTNLQKPSGSYNIYDKDIKINNNQLNKKQYKSNIEGTLIHEIQHAIQDIENFEGGRSSRGSKLAYYESLGEIEASDTKTRFIQEKYKNNDLTSVAPESSKANPKHKNLDNYLKNRKLLDKAKDGVYNYLKKRIGDNNEISKENMAKSKEQNNSLVDDRKRRGYVNEDFGEIYETNKEENSSSISEDNGLVLGGIETKESENNSGSFSMDNKGRTLTKEQQQRFKDSKILDRNGLLLTVYHGTNSNFTVFKNNYVGENTKNAGFYGDGFYFTPFEDSARQYGKNKIEAYLNITNPFSFSELSKYNGEDYYTDYVQIMNLTKINSEWNDIPVKFASKQTWGDISNDVQSMLEQGKTDEEIDNAMYEKYGEISERLNDRLYHYSKVNGYKTLSEALKEQGYDGIINSSTPENSSEIVAFNSNQIKNVDNLNPTADVDIRYSLSENKKDNQGRLLSKEQQEYFKDSKVRDENGNLLTMYHSTNADFNEFSYEFAGTTGLTYGRGFYFTDSQEASKYYGNNTKEVYLDIRKPMEIGKTQMSKNDFRKLVNAVNEETNGTLELDYGNLEDAVSEYDYGGDDIDLTVSLKSASGLSDVKFYKLLKDTLGFDGIKANNQSSDTNGNFWIAFQSNQIKYIDNTNPSSDNDMRLSMTNDTLIAGDDIAVKDMLKQEKTTIEDEVGNTKIDVNGTGTTTEVPTVEEVITQTEEQKQQEIKDGNIDKKLNENKGKITRKKVRQQLLKEMNIKEEELANGNDISSLNFQVTDPVRVNEKVFGREIGKKINDVTINKTKHNTAEKIRWQNREREDIKNLGIKARSKESAAVQKYGEKQYVDEYGKTHEYGDKELAIEFKDEKTQNKIKNAAKVIREKYDTYIDQMNNTLTALGYDAIPKRENYMRHFQELTDKFSQAGIPLNLNDMKAEDLPTDINGLTEFNKPGRAWFASAMERTGEKTNYDAITGIDGYLEGAGNYIFHTEDIQNYRALSTMIRETYGRMHGLDNIENMTEEQIIKRFEDIKGNKLSKYVAWLDEQANSLAGKKGAIDRGVERMLGRRAYTIMNTAKKQVGSNMTGFNVRSALTNLISSVIASSKTNKVAFMQGTISTINNMIHKDDFIDKSDFLTARFGSDALSSKIWQKISNAGQIFMTATDYFTSNQIVRSKYYEGLYKGMSEDVAIKYADDFAARVMGDRAQGSTAEIFNSKTLGLLTQFQLEVNNQWQFMIHDTKMDFQQNSQENSGLKAGATIIWQMGQMAAYSYMFNELFEKLTGSRAAFDPIEIFKTLFGLDDDDEEKSWEERIIEANKQLVDNLPFASIFTGGRIPVEEAFTGISTFGKKITGQEDSYGNEISWKDVVSDMLDSAAYWVLPTGYSQLKKTTGGLEMYTNKVAGSYTDSGNLRYTVDDDVGSKAQAAVFGAYANPYAQDYIDSGYKAISKDNIEEMVGLDMNSTEYRQYRKGLSNVSKTTDENGYKQYVDDNNKVYWYDSDSEIMYDNNYKKTTLTADDLIKVSKTEEALNYINSLDLTDKQKNIAANNLNKNSKKTIDMSEYGNYSSYDEYKYARDYPEKYSVVSQITDYDSFVKYKDDIADIKEKYSTEAGYESKERKTAVQSYINNLDLNMYQKMMLEKVAGGYSIKNYQNYIQEYLETTDLSNSEKYTIWEELFN